MVATRTITEGELVPAGAVGDAAKARTTSVVVRSAVDVPASVEAGTVVEVWSAPLLEQGEYDVPRILVADATVVSVTRDDSMIGGGSASLELVIPRADVAATLAAMAGGSALSVVPTAGAADEAPRRRRRPAPISPRLSRERVTRCSPRSRHPPSRSPPPTRSSAAPSTSSCATLPTRMPSCWK